MTITINAVTPTAAPMTFLLGNDDAGVVDVGTALVIGAAVVVECLNVIRTLGRLQPLQGTVLF